MKRQLLVSIGLALSLALPVACTAQNAEAPRSEQPQAAAQPAPAPQPAQVEKPAQQQAPAAAAPKPQGPVNVLVPPAQGASPFLTEQNFVTKWAVLGPFTFAEDAFGGEHQQGAVDNQFIPNEAELTPAAEAPKGSKWTVQQFKEGAQAGAVDLDKLYDSVDHAAAYAVSYLESPTEVENAKLYLGSDDYIKVWVNGKLVHSYKTERRGSDWDQDVAQNVHLNKGLNRVVVKVVDVVGGFDFYFRLTDAKDMPYTVKAAE